MKKIYIEARINEYAMRGQNKNIPWTVDEIVEEAVRCRESGATILHYHARFPDGTPNNSIETNAEIIGKIRQRTDILIHPTLGFNSNDQRPRERIDAIAKLCADERVRPDIVPIDPGSLNLESYDANAKRVENAGNLYINSTDTIMYAAEVFSRLGLTIQFFCWGVTFVRRGSMLMDLGLIKHMPHFVFHLTEGTNISSNPATKLGMDSMLEMLPGQCPWSVACGGGSLLDMTGDIARAGGNLSIGLGDYSYTELGMPTNGDVISRAAEISRENGREIATLEETKGILGIA